jgi:hypothetical protein
MQLALQGNCIASRWEPAALCSSRPFAVVEIGEKAAS